MKRIQLTQFAICLLTTILSISCTHNLSIDVQDWINLSDDEIELDLKNNIKIVTVSSKVAWTATSDADWIAIEPSTGNAGETEVQITSTLKENKEATGTINFNSSQGGNLKEKSLTIKTTLIADWITISDEEIELNLKDNSKTVIINSKVAWTATSDVDWLAIEPSKGNAGETEVIITSTLNENKETSGTITFNSSQDGNFKEKTLTVKTTLIADWITISDEEIELDIKDNSKTVTIDSKVAWKANSDVDWFVIEPSNGNAGKTEIEIRSTLNEDKEASGTITFNSSQEGSYKEKLLTVKQAALITDWITLPNEMVELDIKNNSKTITINSEVAWTATPNVNWLVIEPSTGNAGETEVKITSTLNFDKETSGTIIFNSKQAGHFKEQQLMVNTILSTSVSNSNIELSVLLPSATINVYTDCQWQIKSHPEWLTITPIRGSGTSELFIETSERYDFKEEGEIIIVDDKSRTVTVHVSRIKYFDNRFAQALQNKGYITNASKIDLETIKEIESLYINESRLTKLTGIELFESLKELVCYSNQLTSLNISKNINLTVLNCEENQLTSLNVSKNTNLTELKCCKNQLTNLDVSKNINLTYLNCIHNQLTYLNVNNNINLTKLYCGSNQLTSLNISKNKNLTELYCGYNRLTNLDVSKNTNLTYLHCGSNKLKNLDVSMNTSLTKLSCYENQLTNLDVSKNTNLTYLHCGSNKLKNLDVSMNTSLTTLSCYENQLINLNVSKNTNLTELWFQYNPGNGSVFSVKAWFDNNSIPNSLNTNSPSGTWLYDGNRISVNFYKAK